MNDRRRIARFAGTLALIASCAGGKSQRTIVPQATLLMRIDDQAQVPTAILTSAENEAGRLFRAAGMRIAWEHLLYVSPEDEGTDMTAPSPRRPNERRYLVIRLLRRLPADMLPGALGYSLPFAHRGAHVLIFFDRIESLAREVNTAPDTILGHALAHELGHVLLGSTEHTSGGLMQGCWTAGSWHLARAGLLAFDAEQIQRIRAESLKLETVWEALRLFP